MYATKGKNKNSKKSTLYSRAKDAVVKGVQSRYFNGRGYSNPKYDQMAKDVMFLKSVINSEKKRLDQSTALAPVSQCNGNSSGYWIADVTPVPASSSSVSGRTGSSIKLHTSHAQFQIIQQSAASQGVNLKIMFVQVKGAPFVSPTSFITQMYNQNTFVLNSGSPAIIDYNSQLNPDYFGTYKVLRSMKVSVPIDPYSGALQIKTFEMGIKYNNGQGHHIRYSADTTTVADGQIYMIILADSGNQSAGTASTLTGIPTGVINSGCLLSYDLKHYYYDN